MQTRTAFLFDMDGTMLNNMDYHLQAWEKIAAEAGSTMSKNEIFKRVYGKNTEILTRILGEDKFSRDEIREMAKKKDEYYREIYAPHIQLMPGLQEFLEEARKENILTAIATGTIMENVDMILDKLPIRNLFDAIVTGADVKKSKPDPETFVKAAEKLGVFTSDCIVFEDVPEGVEAAQKSGMKAVVVLTSHTDKDFDRFTNVIRKIDDYKVLHVKELVYLAIRDRIL